MNILYDEDDKGSFFQLYSRAWGGELFFEIVQRVGDTRDMERPTHPLESPHRDGSLADRQPVVIFFCFASAKKGKKKNQRKQQDDCRCWGAVDPETEINATNHGGHCYCNGDRDHPLELTGQKKGYRTGGDQQRNCQYETSRLQRGDNGHGQCGKQSKMQGYNIQPHGAGLHRIKGLQQEDQTILPSRTDSRRWKSSRL